MNEADRLELGDRVLSELLYENELEHWTRLFFLMRRTEQWAPMRYESLLTFVRRGVTVRHQGQGQAHFAVCGPCAWRSQPTSHGIAHARHLALTEHRACVGPT